MVAPFRTLLLWLLMLAIPVQGLAATTMAFCGPKHHDDVVAVVAGHASTNDGVEAPAAYGHHHGGDAGAQANDPSADQHQCNVCGSCCSVGALIGAQPALPACDAASTVFASVVATIDPFVADGPDRPPRDLLV